MHDCFSSFIFYFSLDKLKCLEEEEDPEVIPENSDLVTLGYEKPYFYYMPLHATYLNISQHYSKIVVIPPPKFNHC